MPSLGNNPRAAWIPTGKYLTAPPPLWYTHLPAVSLSPEASSSPSLASSCTLSVSHSSTLSSASVLSPVTSCSTCSTLTPAGRRSSRQAIERTYQHLCVCMRVGLGKQQETHMYASCMVRFCSKSETWNYMYSALYYELLLIVFITMETAFTISSYQSVPPPSSQSQVGIGQQNTIVGERDTLLVCTS